MSKKKKKPAKKTEVMEEGTEISIEEERPSYQFKLGNTVWKASLGLNGRKGLYESPEQMWDDAVQYFEWIQNNPEYINKVFVSNGLVIETAIPISRPMTIQGMCVFHSMSFSTYENYRHSNTRNQIAFRRVMDQIKNVMYDQKFNGAATKQFDPRIISMELGLVAKSEISADVKTHEENLADLK